MLFRIYEDRRCIVSREEFDYEWGLKEIKSVKESLERRNVEERVIKDLDSIQKFWESNNLMEKFGDSNPYNVLKKDLAHFTDERRTKFLDSGERVQKLLNELRECIIEEKDLEVIKKIEEFEKGTIMTVEEFLDNIDYEAKVLEIADRYYGSNHEKEIIRYQFVKDAVKRFGVSDSNLVMILLRKIRESLRHEFKASEGIPDIVLELEAYRCVVKGSTETLQC